MQSSRPALRLLRQAARNRRCLATATAGHAPTASHVHTPAAEPKRAPAAAIPLSNIEAQWALLSPDEKSSVAEQLEELQKRDWNLLSHDEKKAAYYVAFGPHGRRKPIHEKGEGFKIFLGVVAAVGLSGVLWYAIRHVSPPPPQTMSKEWQEAMNERALEQKMNPLTGIASEGYKGPGFVQSK
ncbi:cytochrome c oxidase subunit IV-domain-containing protein [Mycena pura]|uniref:Cytochrome c oxidase subunit IV-domain-containing protein n=1 Tax=Mycena pura TaxID=153505 RepID=A0AAD6YUR2_9AGAR|nr:cytochrome c oxidase subunit IV-domain-containing protein [Mycena pura]